MLARVWIAAAAIGLSACGSASTTSAVDGSELPTSPEGGTGTAVTVVDADVALFAERMAAVEEAVAAWRDAPTVAIAHESAEAAANLIVGPNGPGYGDRSGDGVVGGQSAVGLLPGIDGTPAGIAIPLSANRCVGRDVLGGTWADPGAKWGAMLTAIDEWRPDNNTMPTLASHPMRVVGWATFTLDSDSLGDAHEYAGHAKLHVDISVRALSC